MAAKQHKRLSKEMMDFNNDPVPGVEIKLVNDQITKWNVIIDGPEDSPYKGGKFTVNIDFSDNYPFKCPKLLFVTKIYHPNIKTDTGEICQQAIQNSWVPTLNANFIVKMLIELLQNPNSENPMENNIASEL
mmetsp:Transcript_13037/g.22012  ORF Transcript_13037/g.22012 Transcript_13037/m.22012 type:complete len:132 (+) Transcript_13037:42-437(+)|eukprot:CAMPEP_0168617580 /NCGR_PEP_ID=MMETSP0449_2-20121227/5613_1 /TAXON_ID=1082188 /ORGANISM="Strombidium rassoulzadegani, Strain ras09" /LENGTH=131 /DNA_ID=CAMNT_0008658395 /DNA_START=15 /DNA_END=410 /DNA_ORIENTATION=+